MKAHVTGLALSAVVSLIWASSFFLIKAGIRETDPLAFAGYRYLLGGAILAGYVVWRRGWTGGRRAWYYATICGALAYLIGQGFLYVAQAMVTPLAGAFFYSLAPAFVLVLSIAWLRRAPTLWQIVGLAIIVAGSLLFARPGTVATLPTIAVIEFCISNVATAAYLLVMRRALDEGISGQWLSAMSLILGGATLIVVTPAMGRPLELAQTSLVPLVWLAVINTAVAYGLYVRALALVQPFEMSVMNASIPLEAALIGWIVLGVGVDPIQLIGLLVASAGIVAVQLGALAALRPS